MNVKKYNIHITVACSIVLIALFFTGTTYVLKHENDILKKCNDACKVDEEVFCYRDYVICKKIDPRFRKVKFE